MYTRPYSADEIKFLEENYKTSSVLEMSYVLERSEHGIRKQLSRLGLTLRSKSAKPVLTEPIIQPQPELLEALTPEPEKAAKTEKVKTLADYKPRELMAELARRGYVGKLHYTEVITKEHVIDITKL